MKSPIPSINLILKSICLLRMYHKGYKYLFLVRGELEGKVRGVESLQAVREYKSARKDKGHIL
jgi:hypothetical protein